MVRTLQQDLKNLDAEEYEALRSMCHLSKNLSNKTLYEVRQHYFNNGAYLKQSFQLKEDHIRLRVPYSLRNEFGYDLTEIQIPFTYEEVQEANVKPVQILPQADAQ
ncbi:MAG: hypothetical protein J07HQX50_00508 [Haloquadratum sp. J07HQX50]|jgi:hypothetical protein|nr:MAG: hypothetical protein J07HQX50_00508 [Haloquadratum sp. J07HQX50]